MLNSKGKNHYGRWSSTPYTVNSGKGLPQPIPNPSRYRYSAEEAFISDELANLGNLLSSLESFSEKS